MEIVAESLWQEKKNKPTSCLKQSADAGNLKLNTSWERLQVGHFASDLRMPFQFEFPFQLASWALRFRSPCAISVCKLGTSLQITNLRESLKIRRIAWSSRWVLVIRPLTIYLYL
ncbi:uncharacterized protein LOC110008359 [Amborella trichopoda]|uniref:uncharacterized protein LOC110008359 n=1 Tax=Amborella trichopoda TaxID=13333 RepID=UPI0009BDC333|nr:uncharacterized protein LOC110008359 [Amborella trichopoda]|eukprot:XP_020530884.1 uncharacterized protein LOC110008359 [Amborella trichopoda]